MANDLKSMNEALTETANKVIEDRVRQWVSYTFDKEWLPYIVKEIKDDMHFTIQQCAESAGFKVEVTYTPKPKDSKKESK